MKVLANKSVYLDIMLKGRFIKQLRYEYCPIFDVKAKDLKKFVESKMPSLKGKGYNINFSNQRV